ncbi:MAG: TM2 domain-containing protein [Victivallales bacterium]|nr:TM2 domain-containing protein [Victivallales bacterium]
MGNNSSITATKIVAGILGIFLGGLGIHKFFLGYIKEGIIMLCCSLFGCILFRGIPGIIGIIGLIEGILYLIKSDEEFKSTYINGKRPWF